MLIACFPVDIAAPLQGRIVDGTQRRWCDLEQAMLVRVSRGSLGCEGQSALRGANEKHDKLRVFVRISLHPQISSLNFGSASAIDKGTCFLESSEHLTIAEILCGYAYGGILQLTC